MGFVGKSTQVVGFAPKVVGVNPRGILKFDHGYLCSTLNGDRRYQGGYEKVDQVSKNNVICVSWACDKNYKLARLVEVPFKGYSLHP